MPKAKIIRPKESDRKKRTFVSQQDVPSFSLDQALRIPEAIAENYGNRSATPLQVAKALQLGPNSSQFKMLTGASIA
ncbi:MAG: hypothetical protein ACREBV_01525, partial [Candidatus Zixiibacteriota bacterium]